MKSIQEYLSGKKTFLLSVAYAILALCNHFGYVNDNLFDLLSPLLIAAGAITMRLGINKAAGL